MNTSLAKSSWRSFTSDERNLFTAGCCMLICWIACTATLWRIGHPMWDDILSLGFTQLFIGRAAAIAAATQISMNTAAIIVFTSLIDIMTVCILFPILTFSSRSLFKKTFYQKHIKPVFEAASKSMNRFSEAKFAGVLLFVWFPFWGTGVVAGAVLGYLLGLKAWINMCAVCIGTVLAVLCWVFAYDRLFDALGHVGNGVPVAFTVVLIAGLLAWRALAAIKHTKGNGRRKQEEPKV